MLQGVPEAPYNKVQATGRIDTAIIVCVVILVAVFFVCLIGSIISFRKHKKRLQKNKVRRVAASRDLEKNIDDDDEDEEEDEAARIELQRQEIILKSIADRQSKPSSTLDAIRPPSPALTRPLSNESNGTLRSDWKAMEAGFQADSSKSTELHPAINEEQRKWRNNTLSGNQYIIKKKNFWWS